MSSRSGKNNRRRPAIPAAGRKTHLRPMRESNLARSNFLFTSESVSEGHPDKVCDRISDAVVDLYLAADPFSRVACETLTTTNKIVLAGEVRGPDTITKEQIEETARNAVKAIGYEQEGFHWKTADCEVLLHAQSVDIAQGVDAAGNKDEGAGDQGIMFGYACTETDVLMPSPIYYAHRILKRMAEDRHSGKHSEFEPDAKSQVTMKYENGKPVGVTSVVVSTQHKEGAFSGKDPTKVDRSAAYASRYLAKNVVAAGLAERCTLQLAYAIGVSKPLSIYVDLHGTGKVEEEAVERAVAKCMDLSPRGIRAPEAQQADL